MKQNQFAIGVVVIIVLLVSAIGFLLLRNPTKQSTVVTAPVSPSSEPQKQAKILTDDGGQPLGDISVSSSMPGYDLALSDKEGLLNELRKWDLFGVTYNDNFGVSNSPVSHLSIELTDKQQPYFARGGKGVQVFSSNIVISEGAIKEIVYVGPAMLKNFDNINLNFELYAIQILSSFDATDTVRANQAAVNNAAYYKDVITQGNLHFKITKSSK